VDTVGGVGTVSIGLSDVKDELSSKIAEAEESTNFIFPQ